jgi:hypothetical protein
LINDFIAVTPRTGRNEGVSEEATRFWARVVQHAARHGSEGDFWFYRFSRIIFVV